MLRIKARKLLGFSTAQLFDILTGEFILVFDDGEELVTNWRETCYSSYAWDFHRLFPHTQLLKQHHVRSVIGNKPLNVGTPSKLVGKVMWDVYSCYSSHDSNNLDRLSELTYRIINEIYCDLTKRSESACVSLDILAFHGINKNKDIIKVKAEMEPTQAGITHAQEEVKRIIRESPDLSDNDLARALRAGVVNENQVMQCIGPRGYITEADSNLFINPVVRGYAEGIRLFHDSLIESRSATKAHLFAKEPLQAAEYFSRRSQLITQAVRNLHRCDCGTTRYLKWKVRGRELNERGEVLVPGDLPILVGKHYLDEETNTLKTIKGDEKHLIGKIINIRSVIHCAHPDPNGICSVCFGELSLSVPDETNIGQMCCTSLNQKASQSVLSVKHLDGSAAVDWIVLSDYAKQFFRISQDGNSYILLDSMKDKKPKLVIPACYAGNLTDIYQVEDVRELHISRVTDMAEVGFYLDNDMNELHQLPVNLGRRMASLSYAALKHIREVGWSVTAEGHYMIDMEGYEWSKPLMSLPLKQYNMSDYSKDISEMLESNTQMARYRDSELSPDVGLIELNDLVNSKLFINLAVTEVTWYAEMIVSAEDGNYHLPKPWTRAALGVMSLNMMNRSLGPAMAFESHCEVLLSPGSYVETDRPDHPFDHILLGGNLEAHM